MQYIAEAWHQMVHTILHMPKTTPTATKAAAVRLSTAQSGKTRITIRVDNATLAVFKEQAELTDASYQTLMNQALAEYVQGRRLADVIRETIKQQLQVY